MNNVWKYQQLGKNVSPQHDVGSFVAHIILPSDVDRKQYINQCYSTNAVSVKSVDNVVEHFVLVSKDIIHEIKFPLNPQTLGSLVQVIVDPIYNTSKIIGVFNTEGSEQQIVEEGQWRVLKRTKNTFVDIDAKSKTGQLNITVNSGSSEDVKSTLKFLNDSNSAQLDIEVQGNVNLDVDDSLEVFAQKKVTITLEDTDNNKDKVTELKIESGEGFSYKDEFGNEVEIVDGEIRLKNDNGQEFNITRSGFEFKNDSADLKDIISGLFDAINQAVILTPAGPGSISPTTVAQIEKLRASLNLLFS